MATFTIWYMKPDYFRDGIMGSRWLAKGNRLPNPDNLEHTHVELKKIDAYDLDEVYGMMQGDKWSPNGEARELLTKKKLRHTSMSVGDVIVDDERGTAFMVDNFGFLELT